MRASDENLHFHCVVVKADGHRLACSTVDRHEFLMWLTEHRGPEDALVEVGILATGKAIPGILNTIAAGARRPPGQLR